MKCFQKLGNYRLLYIFMKRKFISNLFRNTLLKFGCKSLENTILCIRLAIYVYIRVHIQENIQHLSAVVYIFKLPLVGGINQFFQFHGARTYSTRSSRRLVTIWSYYSNARLLHLRWSIVTVDLPGQIYGDASTVSTEFRQQYTAASHDCRTQLLLLPCQFADQPFVTRLLPAVQRDFRFDRSGMIHWTVLRPRNTRQYIAFCVSNRERGNGRLQRLTCRADFISISEEYLSYLIFIF